MNDAVIIAVANAITAQAETLKALIDALPKETKVAVEKRVAKNTPTVEPKAIVETPAPVVVEAPIQPVVVSAAPVVVETVTNPVVEIATAVPVTIQQPIQQPIQNGMPAAPFPTQLAAPSLIPQPTMQSASVVQMPVSTPAGADGALPFNDHKSMLQWIMNAYQSVPRDVGARIQEVLNSLGTHNINDVKPEQYPALFSGVNNILGK